MTWDLYLYASLLAFLGINLLGCPLRRIRPGHAHLLSPFTFLFISTIVAGYIWVLPFQRYTTGSLFQALVISIQSVFQMFSLDGDYVGLRELIRCQSPFNQALYQYFGTVLYAMAPIMTVGMILSFFRNLSAQFRVMLSFSKRMYVFSELNESALALAESCLEHDQKSGVSSLVVFTDVYPAKEELGAELQSRAHALKAVCLSNDIVSPLFLRHGKNKELLFFVLGSDEAENIQQTLSLVERYRAMENVSLYPFASSRESALLIGSVMDEDLTMTLRRVNPVQSLVYRQMYRHNLFERAYPLPNGEKLISLAILGLGQYGAEFLKAAVWCGQIPGYRIEIHVFEANPEAESLFTAECPELMKLNHSRIDGEAQYDIYFHRSGNTPGINVRTCDFDEQICALGNLSTIFVALGSDTDSIELSVKLRMLTRRSQPQFPPVINAVFYQAAKADLVSSCQLNDYKGNDYDIHFIGDLRATYSYDVVLDSELEARAKARHLLWVDQKDRIEMQKQTRNFYKYEYFYRSSIASVIRRKLRVELGIPGIEKAPADRTPEERVAIQKMEHTGWNAYMRTEGYCWAPQRDDLAKLHPNLVPFDQLPPEIQQLDDD